MPVLYDPPSGWMYGFPKPYKPLEGESLAQTLIRDGYPPALLPGGEAKRVRFLGSAEELKGLNAS